MGNPPFCLQDFTRWFTARTFCKVFLVLIGLCFTLISFSRFENVSFFSVGFLLDVDFYVFVFLHFSFCSHYDFSLHYVDFSMGPFYDFEKILRFHHFQFLMINLMILLQSHHHLIASFLLCSFLFFWIFCFKLIVVKIRFIHLT